LALTSGTLNTEKTLDDAMELIRSIESGFNKTGNSPEDLVGLSAKLASLQLPFPNGDALDSRQVPSTRYTLSDNELGFTNIQVLSGTINIWKQGSSPTEPFLSAKIGYRKWERTANGQNPFGKALLIGQLGVSGAWVEDNLVIEIISAETVCGHRYEFSFKPHHASIDFKRIPDGAPHFRILGIEE